MLKKIVIALFAAAMLAVPLVGCGGEPTTTVEESEKDYVVVKLSEGEKYRHSFEYKDVYEHAIYDPYGVTGLTRGGQDTAVVSVGILSDGSGSVVKCTRFDDRFLYTEKILPNELNVAHSYAVKLSKEKSISYEEFMGEENLEEISDGLNGTSWRIVSLISDGEDQMEVLDSMGGAVCKFKNGTLVLEMAGQTETIAPYTYENGELKIDGDTVEINGDTISYQMGNDTLVMKKQ